MDTETSSRNETNRKPSPGVILYNAMIVTLDLIFLLIRITLNNCYELYLKLKGVEEKDIKDDIVLITGTGHGIGKELALQYSKLGSTVVCWDMNEQLNQETVKTIKSLGGKAFGFTVDVTNRQMVLEIGSKVLKEIGDVSILVNNAGIMPQHDFLKHTEAEIRKIYEVNTLAHCWMFQAFLPKMIEKRKGHVVALSSIAGLVGLPNLVPYCGSKAAVRGQMEAMRMELLARGHKEVKFTTVFPYMVDTGLCKNVRLRFENFMRLLKPSEVAAAIISAQRREIDELTVPRYLLYLNNVVRLFPKTSAILVNDFFDSGVESDL